MAGPIRPGVVFARRRQPGIATDGAPYLASPVRSLSTRPEIPPKDRKRIRPDEKLPLELNDRERELILKHSFADEELTGRLCIVPGPTEPPIYRFTLDDLNSTQ